MGREINFKNTICVMTSNIGANKIIVKNKVGFVTETNQEIEYNKLKNEVTKELESNFSLEFLNRIDEVIVFRKLNIEDIKNITVLMLNEIKYRLKKQDIIVSFTKELVDYISSEGMSEKYGARQIKRIIKNVVETKIADFILENKLDKKYIMLVDYTNTNVVIHIEKKEIEINEIKQEELV